MQWERRSPLPAETDAEQQGRLSWYLLSGSPAKSPRLEPAAGQTGQALAGAVG
ncbi:hypothetical protein GGTG_06092 [Gaeumannomyces tritici R3-111a-1]|uniref:Uncharacterized protein n=1 Tax=Gaeumannomyces tritici (strain R3-111a-1) TaxID=644352 RepID=J3NXT7_GAET3|nr:hypothetical protein GGTG_06092 [Gaeumannomyces tritici R3-111a-1]EJT76170.1 hypothetical protein GGTG_06092 [Gaeumannomyces tritici R3-111a-1]